MPVNQDKLGTSPPRNLLLAALLDVLAHAQDQSNSQSNPQSNYQSISQSNCLGDDWNAMSPSQQSERTHDALCLLLHTMLETASPVIIPSQISSRIPSRIPSQIPSQIPIQNASAMTGWHEWVVQSHRDVLIGNKCFL